MSFEQRETSRYHGSPANLFLFRYGENALARFGCTDAEQSQVYDGVNYVPRSISLPEITQSSQLDQQTLEITMADTNEIAALFRGFPPSYNVALTVYRGHLSEETPDWRVLWTGRVLSAKFDPDDNTAQLSCEPLSSAFRRPGLRRSWMVMCPHVLYGAQCKASREANSFSVVPSALGAGYIDLPASWVSPEETKAKFVGGLVEWQGPNGVVLRTILSVTSTRLVLNGDTSGLIAGQSVKLSIGCNHQVDDCKDIHNNILNYGGQPFMPGDQPVASSSSIYY